jgi:L-lysine 2,3-aminomutase
MIQLSTIPVENKAQYGSWQEQLSQSKLNTSELLARLKLAHHPLVNSQAEQLFELRVPPAYIDKIAINSPNDPLLLQILPQSAEFNTVPGFSDSPLEEERFSPVKGLIHKYANRVLLMASATCAINCRYCFRRSFPYEEHRQAKQDWQAAFSYIKEHENLDEVILSGGDPLTLNNAYLDWLLDELDSIPHIKRIRIHTRMLLSIPERIDTQLLNTLKSLSKQIILVTHCNHPNELGPELKQSFTALREAQVTLLNQSVLLKQVNDNADTLKDLSLALFDLGILPYYLFMFDRVNGAAHFEVNETDSMDIYQQLLTKLPGYLVPRLSQEIPGERYKSLATFRTSNR